MKRFCPLVFALWFFPELKNKKSARNFPAESFSGTPWGHGRPRLRVKEVHAKDSIFDTEYDRAKVPPYNGNDPRPAPGSLKAPLLPPLLNNVQTRECKGCKQGTARNFLHSFPLSSAPVVQSYWAWIFSWAPSDGVKVFGRGRPPGYKSHRDFLLQTSALAAKLQRCFICYPLSRAHFKGVVLSSHTLTTHTPLIKGVELHPLN